MKPSKGRNASARHITKVSTRAATTPSAPPAYRPQPTPKVLQRKVAVATARPPVAQSKVRSTPKVVQAKRAEMQSRVGRAPSVLPHASTTIQRAFDARWATSVKATFGDAEAKGQSGHGAETGALLRRAVTPAKTRFEQILQAVTPKNGRTGFTCAEPNAVAWLLDGAGGPQTVDDLFKVRVNTAYDSRGGKAECPVCSQWIDHGGIIDLTEPIAARSASGGAPTTSLDLMAYLKPAKVKKGREKKSAAAAAAMPGGAGGPKKEDGGGGGGGDGGSAPPLVRGQ